MRRFQVARDRSEGYPSGHAMIPSASLVQGFRSDVLLLELSFPLQLRVVKTACIAKSSCSVGSSPPFRGVYPVAAVTTARRCGALYSLVSNSTQRLNS